MYHDNNVFNRIIISPKFNLDFVFDKKRLGNTTFVAKK